MILELQQQGYNLPDYPENVTNDEQQSVKDRYDKIKGSAVNPVLREGNSDRRAPPAVKKYVRSNPHAMGAWTEESQTHVASMADQDFFANEKSVTIKAAGNIRIELQDDAGNTTVLKQNTAVIADEIIDATVMNTKALRQPIIHFSGCVWVTVIT